MITLLDRLVFKRLALSFCATTLGLACAFLMAAAYRLLQGEGLALAQVLRALPLVVPFLLPFLLPVSLVVAIALVYGRMLASGEVVAWSSLGIAPRVLLAPALLLGLGISVVSLLLTTTLVPRCYRLQQEIFQDSYAGLATGSGEHLSLSLPRQGLAIYVRRRTPAGLEGIVVRCAEHGVLGKGELRGSLLVVARSGSIETSPQGRTVLDLHDVVVSVYRRGPPPAGEPEWAGSIEPPTRAFLERLTLDPASLAGEPRPPRLAAMSSAEVARRRDAAERLSSARGEASAQIDEGLEPGGGDDSRAAQVARAAEAERELAERAALAGLPFLVALWLVPLLLTFDASSPLLSLVWGVAASGLVVFVPHALGTSLASAWGSPALCFLSWASSLATACALLCGRSRL